MDPEAIVSLSAGGLVAAYVYAVAVCLAARASWRMFKRGLSELSESSAQT